MSCKIIEIRSDKKKYMNLLLLADEQESMIDTYLERGVMLALEEDGVKAVCVVTDEGNDICELKNIAVAPEFRRKGYGKRLITYLLNLCSKRFTQMIVGTGDVPGTIGFYRDCGFELSHRIADFFTDNYDHPIMEEGIQLKDMIYLKQNLTQR